MALRQIMLAFNIKTEKGTFTSVGLTAAKGKEGFYERSGLKKSAGMTKYIEC